MKTTCKTDENNVYTKLKKKLIQDILFFHMFLVQYMWAKLWNKNMIVFTCLDSLICVYKIEKKLDLYIIFIYQKIVMYCLEINDFTKELYPSILFGCLWT